MSTAAKPKHLLPLIGTSSLFEQTLERFADRDRFGPPIIVATMRRRASWRGFWRCRRRASDPRAESATARRRSRLRNVAEPDIFC